MLLREKTKGTKRLLQVKVIDHARRALVGQRVFSEEDGEEATLSVRKGALDALQKLSHRP